MGTILDYVSVYSNINAIRTASRSVSLPASATEIKGQSDAMKKLQEDYETLKRDRKSTRLNSSHKVQSRMPSSA